MVPAAAAGSISCTLRPASALRCRQQIAAAGANVNVTAVRIQFEKQVGQRFEVATRRSPGLLRIAPGRLDFAERLLQRSGPGIHTAAQAAVPGQQHDHDAQQYRAP
jgi:hypothetical protein